MYFQALGRNLYQLAGTVIKHFGSGAISGKMLLVRIVENNKIDAYIGQVRFAPQKGIMI